jgi:hypothetical protein
MQLKKKKKKFNYYLKNKVNPIYLRNKRDDINQYLNRNN